MSKAKRGKTRTRPPRPKPSPEQERDDAGVRNLLHFAHAAVDVVNRTVGTKVELLQAARARHRLACAATALDAACSRLELLMPHLDPKGRRKKERTEPDYSHREGEYVYLAPAEPLLHKCPDCTENERASKARVKKTYRLTFLHSFTETWGCVVTRHDVYRCRGCGERWVSTNGREPDVAAPGI